MGKLKWANTTILKGNLAEAVKGLKNKKGKSIIVYGGESASGLKGYHHKGLGAITINLKPAIT